MTTLLLSVTSGPSGAINQTRVISSGAFQVGRARPSDWVLEDPRRVVSKRHCVFHQDERGWTVEDVSRNGSFLRRGDGLVRLGPQPHPLSAGERLRLGDYELAVDLEEDEASFRVIPLSGTRGGARPARHPPPPPDVPPRVLPLPQRAADTDRDDADPPTRFVLFPGQVARPRDAADDPDAVLQGLAAAVAGLRRLRASLSSGGGERAASAAAAILLDAPDDAAALRGLLSGFCSPATAIEAAVAEVRLRHERTLAAVRHGVRGGVRGLIDTLDPDQPARQLLPHWSDLLPGFRRRREQALARRRFRRMMSGLDRAVSRAIEQAAAGPPAGAAPAEGGRDAGAAWQPG